MAEPAVLVIDYGMGNFVSVANMLRKAGAKAVISSRPEDVHSATKIILPGVGAFDRGMRHLHDLGFVEALRRRVIEDGVPTLGICLGMQLLTKSSEEGVEPGLGWVDATTTRVHAGELPVPHMGWNVARPASSHPLFEGLGEEPRFYFVHSYRVECASSADVVTTTTYGSPFVSAFAHGNVMGTQFHPEKSHKYGLTLLRNFAALP
jgi:imidazole glycerol-phosphate synthase subunit HisH